jgi:predicted nucleic acid-binding protein
VFDTNVLVSASLLPNSKPRKALDLALKQGKLLLSLIAVLTREAEWVDVDVRIAACRDPKDDKFLELAVSGRATCIISGDSDLLALTPFRGISIMTAQDLLEQ